MDLGGGESRWVMARWTCLPACLPAWLPGCLPAWLAAWLPACLPGHLHSAHPTPLVPGDPGSQMGLEERAMEVLVVAASP